MTPSVAAPVTIVIAGEPVAKARPRFTRRRIAYTPAHVRKYEAHGRLAAQLAMGDRPPIEVPVRLELVAELPIPASWSERKRALAIVGDLRPTSRPDVDNARCGLLKQGSEMNPTVAPAAPLAVASTAAHDREWWLEEAVRTRTVLSEVSLERAWTKLNRGDGQAPQATVEALVYGLRDGIDALPTKPERPRRLSELSADQLQEVCARLQNFKPTIARPWTADEVDALVSIWIKSHG